MAAALSIWAGAYDTGFCSVTMCAPGICIAFSPALVVVYGASLAASIGKAGDDLRMRCRRQGSNLRTSD
jgi:hypothetical protein